MLTTVKKLKGCTLQATDGQIGKVDELYFEEDFWVVRYLVVNAGNWLSRNQVLIVPAVIKEADPETGSIIVSLTREQVKNSPDVDTSRPVSREKELALHEYYEWDPYWQFDSAAVAAMSTYPGPNVPLKTAQPEDEAIAIRRARADNGGNNLQSTDDITGYQIHASDGEIGHVADLVVDHKFWVIRYMIVDTGNWLPGKRVLVSTGWVQNIPWSESKVNVSLSQASVKDSPEYSPDMLISRDYEEQLYKHYGKTAYWDG